jgi:hypothetical protein
MPPGTGVGYSFLVTARTVVGSPSQATFAYQPPSILHVEPLLLHTPGGEITVYGTNFGPEIVPAANQTYLMAVTAARRRITVGGSACAPTFWNDSQITCVAGPGVVVVRNLCGAVVGIGLMK